MTKQKVVTSYLESISGDVLDKNPASLRMDGTISADGNISKTTTASAKAIAKRPINGWWFWAYRDAKGDWVRLKTLKL